MNETVFTGKVVLEFESLDSTNSYAQSLLADGNVYEGTLVTAKYQAGGKGYSGNRWESEPGKNLLVSIILKPVFLSPRRQFFLNQAITLAVADTVKELTGKSGVKIKWPNDIFFRDKKIAGILIENAVQGDKILHSVIGIGLNVNQQKFSPELNHVTSLREVYGKELDLLNVRDLLCEKTETRYLQLKYNHIEALQKDYMKQLYRVGEEYMYSANGVRFNAKIAGITAEGKLVLQRNDHHEVFGFKEVEFLM